MESQPTDNELIDEALRGQSEAFGRLVRRYQDRLFHTLCHIMLCDADAYDVVQDAFVQAFVKLESFERKAGFYTWLYRIGLNLAATRRRRSRPTLSIDAMHDQCDHTPPDRGEAPDAPLERDETVSQVQAAIARLADEFREVLVLREIEGCDYETIAQLLDVPVGTVRSRLHRARSQLREHLQGTIENGEPRHAVPTKEIV